MSVALKLKKGDTVQMLTGKDRGKQGRIIDARPRDGKVVVENLNLVTKHQKPRPIRDAGRMGGTQIAPGGRVERAAPVSVSNVMLVCPTCGLPTRVGYFDLGNYDSTGNIVTLSVGANAVLIRDRLEFGAVYTTTLASQFNFNVNGLLVKMTLRF